METPIKTYMNWSGGKDSSLSLFKVLSDKSYSVEALLTNVNAVHNRISMHGVRRELLTKQAAAIGIPLHTIELPEQPGMAEYEAAMQAKVSELKKSGYKTAVFGDIFLEDLKKYREEKLALEKMECLFPLWKQDSSRLMDQFLDLGFKAIVVCVNSRFLDKSFCGRVINESFVRDLPSDVDICGENGEYHSFVFDGPIFRYPVDFNKGKIVKRTYPAPAATNSSSDPIGSSDPIANRPSAYDFYFCDLI